MFYVPREGMIMFEKLQHIMQTKGTLGVIYSVFCSRALYLDGPDRLSSIKPPHFLPQRGVCIIH